VFADSRKFAEEWTYRFLGTALSDLSVSFQIFDRKRLGDRSFEPLHKVDIDLLLG